MNNISSFIALLSVALVCWFVVELVVARPSHELKFKPMGRRDAPGYRHRFRPHPRGPVFKLGQVQEAQSDNNQGKCTVVRGGLGMLSFRPEQKAMQEECDNLCKEHEKKTGQEMFGHLFDATPPPLRFGISLPNFICECCTDPNSWLFLQSRKNERDRWRDIMNSWCTNWREKRLKSWKWRKCWSWRRIWPIAVKTLPGKPRVQFSKTVDSHTTETFWNLMKRTVYLPKRWGNNTCRRGRYDSRYTVTAGGCAARGAHDGWRYGRQCLRFKICCCCSRFWCCCCDFDVLVGVVVLKPTNVTTTAIARAVEWWFCSGYDHCWKVGGCCCCSIVTNRGITCAHDSLLVMGVIVHWFRFGGTGGRGPVGVLFYNSRTSLVSFLVFVSAWVCCINLFEEFQWFVELATIYGRDNPICWQFQGTLVQRCICTQTNQTSVLFETKTRHKTISDWKDHSRE